MSGRSTKRLPLLAIALLFAVPATAFGGFSPSLFQFRTTLQDDGKTEPGGWQEATTQLNFVDARFLIPKAWSCRVKVGTSEMKYLFREDYIGLGARVNGP